MTNDKDAEFSEWLTLPPRDFIENTSGEILNSVKHIRTMTDFIKNHTVMADQMDMALLDDMTLETMMDIIAKHCDSIYEVLQVSAIYRDNMGK